MSGKIPTILYLDGEYQLWFGGPTFQDLRLVLIPEVITRDRFHLSFPQGIEVKEDQVLNPTGDDMSVYNPTRSLLERIQQITESGEIDLVILGNNVGAGVRKAPYIVEALRERTLITGDSAGNRGAYQALGYQHFAPREWFDKALLDLLKTLN